MAYCTADNVRTRLPAVPLAGENAKVDQRIADGIATADGQINACLRKLGVTLPLATVDPLLTGISSALAAADCIDGGLSGGGEDEPTPLSVRLRAWAERMLDKLCSGDLVLDGVDLDIGAGEDGTIWIPGQHSDPEQTQELDCWDIMGPL